MILVLFKHRRAALTFLFATIATVFVGMVLSPPSYEASAAVLVKKAQTEMPFVPMAQSEPIVVEVSLEDLNSEIEILKNRALTRGVLDDLGLSEAEEPSVLRRMKDGLKSVLGMPVMSAADDAVLNLEEALSFRAIDRSNIIELRYESDDPDRAALVLQSLIDRYLDYRLQVHQTPRAAEFFDNERTRAQDRLDTAEDELAAYVREAGLSLPLDDRKAVALARLDQFERLLAEALVEVQEGESRFATLQARLAEEPERLQTPYRLNTDPETEEIRRRLIALRSQRDDLRTRGYAETNVRVSDLAVQIQLAEQQLAQAELRAGDIDGTEVNPIYQSLRTQFVTAQADLESARARYSSLSGEVARFRAELDAMSERSYDINRLQREATTAEDAYLLYAQKAEEARVSSAMEGEKTVNVTIARAPDRPLRPTGAPKSLVLASTMILATLGGVGLAFTREALDRSFTTGDDIERELGIRHVASVPEVVATDLPEDEQGQSSDGRRMDPLVQRALRDAYQRISHELISARAKVVLVAGAVEGEGASTVVRNMAVSLSQSGGGRVLVVDMGGPGDRLRTKPLGLLEIAPGVFEQKEERAAADGTESGPEPRDEKADWAVPAVRDKTLWNEISNLSPGFDWVLIDGRPLTQHTETAVLCTQADATVLVLRAESTRVEVARHAVDIVRRSDTDLVGAVLNRRQYHIPQFLYDRL